MIMKNLVMILSLVCILASCQQQPSIDIEYLKEQKNLANLPLNKQKTLDKIGPFKFEQRVSIHDSLTKLTKQLLWSKQYKKLKSVPSKDPKKQYVTVLTDKDGDNKADLITYSNGDSSIYIYDLNKDGKVDYIVYFLEMASLGLTKDQNKIVMNFFHWIDSNYDGKIDILVYPSIDLDGDGFQDEGVYAWLYDSSGDGRIDKAEHAGAHIQQSIDADNGVFKIKSLNMKEIDIGNAGALKAFSGALADINSIIDE
jgi:hypothetical protein